MSKQKGKFKDKPYVSSTDDLHETITESKFKGKLVQTGSHRTYIVKKRLFDEKDKFWGVIAESNGKLYRIDVEKLLEMMTVDKIPFVVDWTGKDKPATLQVVHARTHEGMSYYFRTIGDKYSKNNFKNVPDAKSQSSSFRLIDRLR